MRIPALLLLVLLLLPGLPRPLHAQTGPDGAGERAQAGGGAAAEAPAAPDPAYDPLERFNDGVFMFNSAFDHFVLEPVANVYAAVLPTPAQKGVRNAVSNLDVARKAVNNLLQAKPVAASRELARFIVNTTVGMAGIFDMASKLGLEPSDQDMGTTLGLYGLGHGPYLVLPLLPPTTLRDGLGRVADSFMNPLGYFTPYYVPLSVTAVDTVNDRSLNREAFEALKLSLDPYSAVRDAYLQVRQRKLEQARNAGP